MFIDSVCCAKDSFVMSYNRKYPKKEYLATNFPNPRNHSQQTIEQPVVVYENAHGQSTYQSVYKSAWIWNFLV